MKKILFIGFIVVVAFVGVAVVFLRGENISYSDSQFEVAETQGGCNIDADCVLVQDDWCNIVLAVEKINEAAWEENNTKQTETARQNAQTCEPMPATYQDAYNFSAVCKQSVCVAEFNGNATQ